MRTERYSIPNQRKHDYGELISSIIEDNLSRIQNTSINFYDTYYRESKYYKGNPHIDIKAIRDFVTYIDKYLYYFYMSYSYEKFSNIANSIFYELDRITMLSDVYKKDGYSALYESDNKLITIDPNPEGFLNLSGKEVYEMNVYHELGHIQNNKWEDNALQIIQNLTFDSLNPGFDKTCKKYAIDGFELLNEVTTQFRSQKILECSINRKLNGIHTEKSQLYDKAPYQTSLLIYGLFEAPAIAFAKTLDETQGAKDDAQVLDILSEMALDENFADKIFNQFARRNQTSSLTLMLTQMGALYNANNRLEGDEKSRRVDETSYALNRLLEESNKLQKARLSSEPNTPYQYRKYYAN